MPRQKMIASGPLSLLQAYETALNRLESKIAIVCSIEETAAPDQCVGEYEVRPNFILSVKREGSNLYALTNREHRLELVAESPTRYRVPAMSSVIEFKLSGTAQAISLVIIQDKEETMAKRVK